MRFAVFLLVFPGVLHPAGSDPAILAGRVTDPSGAVVSGVTIQLTNHGGGEVISVTTDRNGEYRAASLPSGIYDVTADYSGFVRFSRSAVRLVGGETVSLQIVLELSTVAGQATVMAKAPAGEGAIETSPSNALEVLEIREVRESAAKDVGEAIAELDGVWKIRKGGIANDVIIRGFQQGDINVLIDGMRVYEACPSQMDPPAYHVDLSEIASVEIVKGPFDIRNFGGLAGTVHVVTKQPAAGLHLTPSLSLGSFGFYNPSLAGSFSFGPVNGSVGYSYRRSDPFVTGSGRAVTEYANYTLAGRDNAAFDSQAGWAKVGFRAGRNQDLQISLARQVDGLTLYPTLAMDAVWDTTDRLNANWSMTELTGVVKVLRAQAYLTQVRQWMTDELRASSLSAPAGYGMATISGARSWGGRVEAELPNMILGLEAFDRGWSIANTQRSGGMGGRYFTQGAMPDVRTVVGGAYSQSSRTLGRLHLTVGARIDAASSDPQSSIVNTDLYWAYQGTRVASASDVAPSGYARITYLLPRGVELYAGAASAIRLPDPEERFYALRRMGADWVGNPLLQPTRNNEADLGINLRTRYVSLRPTLFYSRLSDFVAVAERLKINSVMGVPNSSARSYEGVEAQVRGGELGYSVGLSRFVLLSGGVSYTRGIQYAKPQAGLPRGDMAEIPPLKSRASLRYGNDLFFAELKGLASARQDHVDTFLHEQPTAGFAIFGVKGGVHHKKWNLAMGVDNIGDRFYYEHLSFQRDPDRIGVRIPEPGRSFYVNMSFAFD